MEGKDLLRKLWAQDMTTCHDLAQLGIYDWTVLCGFFWLQLVRPAMQSPDGLSGLLHSPFFIHSLHQRMNTLTEPFQRDRVTSEKESHYCRNLIVTILK